MCHADAFGEVRACGHGSRTKIRSERREALLLRDSRTAGEPDRPLEWRLGPGNDCCGVDKANEMSAVEAPRDGLKGEGWLFTGSVGDKSMRG